MSENPSSVASFFTKALLFIRNFLMALFLDPVAFISLVAPAIISVALGLIHGQLLAQKTPSTPSVLAPILNDSNLPGVADFIIQYYTALLAFVLGFVKHAFYDIFLPYMQKEKNPASLIKDQTESNQVLLFQIYSVALLIFALYTFLGLAPKLSLLEVYTQHTTKFGISSNPLPPWESVLTWLRYSIGIFGLWRFYLVAKQGTRPN